MPIKRVAFIFAICAAALAPLFQGTPAFAQATLTYVSGAGDDANPCSRAAPCKTFTGALAKTAAGGTINCLDTAGFGGVTITTSLTIDCTGALGTIASPNNNNGIVVAGAGVVVSLRALAINGQGSGGIGISITNAASVHIEQCDIYGFTTAGIAFAPTQASGASTVIINDIHVHSNGIGISMDGTGASGDMEVRDVLVDLNTGHAMSITTATNHVGALIERTTLAFNGGTGLNVGGAGALVYLGNSTIVGNNVGVANSGGTFQSFKNNQISGNSTDGTPITAFPGPGNSPLQ